VRGADKVGHVGQGVVSLGGEDMGGCAGDVGTLTVDVSGDCVGVPDLMVEVRGSTDTFADDVVSDRPVSVVTDSCDGARDVTVADSR